MWSKPDHCATVAALDEGKGGSVGDLDLMGTRDHANDDQPEWTQKTRLTLNLWLNKQGMETNED